MSKRESVVTINVDVHFSGLTASEAYDKLCDLLGAAEVEWTSHVYRVDDGPAYDTSSLFPETREEEPK